MKVSVNRKKLIKSFSGCVCAAVLLSTAAAWPLTAAEPGESDMITETVMDEDPGLLCEKMHNEGGDDAGYAAFEDNDSDDAGYTAVEDPAGKTGLASGTVSEIEVDIPAVHEEDLPVEALGSDEGDDLISGTADELPASYSSVSLGIVEKPKKQGKNDCWAYSMASVALTSLLKNYPDSFTVNEVSLSESQLALQCYGESHDPLGLTKGDSTYRYGLNKTESAADTGNPMLAAYELMNWRTPVFSDEDKNKTQATAGHVRDVRFINVTSDRDIIKKLIMEYGSAAIFTRYASSGIFGCNAKGAKYTPVDKNPSNQPANHAMTIVGWDDHYSGDNFTYTPEEDGAWLVKNSYGESDGISSGDSAYDSGGYCWISYEDYYFTKGNRVMTFIGMDDPDRLDNNYGYDGSHNPAATLKDVEKAANVFVLGKPGKTEELKAVSFGTNDAGGVFDIEIYALPLKGNSPKVWDGEPVSAVRGFEAPYPGLYTVELTAPVTIRGAKRFAVVVTPRDKESFTAIIDKSHPDNGGFTFTSTASRGDGYVQIAGQIMDVTDAGDLDDTRRTSNVLRIRAYTKDIEVPEEQSGWMPCYYDAPEALIAGSDKTGVMSISQAYVYGLGNMMYREAATVPETDVEAVYGSLIRRASVFIKNKQTGHYEELTEGVDYDISVQGKNRAGATLKVTFTGKGALKGKKNVSVKLVKNKPLSDPAITVKFADGTCPGERLVQAYTGAKITPAGSDGIVVYNELTGSELIMGKDYKISYKNNKAPGMAVMVLQSLKGGACTGSRTEYFPIDAIDAAGADISVSKTDYKFTGKAIKPAPKVVLDGKKLSPGSYYVLYEDNIYPGTARILVYGKGNYRGLAGEACFNIK